MDEGKQRICGTAKHCNLLPSWLHVEWETITHKSISAYVGKCRSAVRAQLVIEVSEGALDWES